MIKLLYKPTGNIFTLPDDEALNIKNNDRGNDYIVVEAGLQEEEYKTISQEETKQIEVLVNSEIERKDEEEEVKEAKREIREAKKEKKSKKVTSFREDDTEELKKMSKDDLVCLAEKLGIRDMDNKKVDEIIEYIQGVKKKQLKKPGSGRTRKV